MIGKKLRRIIELSLSMFCTLNEKKKYPAYVSKHNINREKQGILLMIPNGEEPEAKSEGQWHYFKRNKIMMIFIVPIVCILLEQKPHLNLMKKFVKTKIFVTL